MHLSRLLRQAIKGDLKANGDFLSYYVKRTVPYKTSKFMNMVKDVNSYQEFLPFCKHSQTTPYKADKKRLTETSNGTLHIGFGNITDKYTSRVVYDPKNSKITAYNLDGAVFKKMTATWSFQDDSKIGDSGLEYATTYEFKIDYKMGQPIYTQVAKHAFPTVSEMMVTSFEKRAKEVAV